MGGLGSEMVVEMVEGISEFVEMGLEGPDEGRSESGGSGERESVEFAVVQFDGGGEGDGDRRGAGRVVGCG